MTLAEQVALVRSGAGLTDRSPRGKLVLRGNDRQTFLHNMLSNAITPLQAGEGCRAELLDEKGHIVADLRVYAGAEDVLLDTEPGLAETVRATLEKYVIMDDATFEDVTDALGLVTVSGPKATEAIARAGLPVPGKLYGHAQRVMRTHWTGAADFDVYVPRADLEKTKRALGVPEISPEAFEVLRIEAGVPRQGADLDGVMPPEAPALEKEAVSYTKGCYLGQEVLARIDARGHVNRTLVGLVLDAVVPAGSPVSHDGREVGRVTSSVVSPTLGKAIALAFVRRDATSGALDVAGMRASVAPLPFVP